jgi:hypothetical protein
MRDVLFDFPSRSIIGEEDIAMIDLIGSSDDVGYGDLSELIIE